MRRELKKLRYSLKDLRNNRTYIVFIAILSVLIFSYSKYNIVSPLFQYALDKGDMISITQNNISRLVTNPLVIILLLVVLLLYILLVLVQLNLIVAILDGELNVFRIIKKLTTSFVKLLNPRALIFIPLIFLLMQNHNLGLEFLNMKNLAIPNFVVDSFNEKSLTRNIYLAFSILVYYLNIRLIDTLIIFIKEPKTGPIESMKKSWQGTRKNTLKIIISMFIIDLLSLFATLLIVYGLYQPIKYLNQSMELYEPIVIGLSSLSLMGMTYISIVRYAWKIQYRLRSYKNEDTCELDNLILPARKILFKGLTLVMIYLYTMTITLNDPVLTKDKRPLVIGHRGSCKYSIENTIESLEEANRMGADYVEMDIQFTKDDKLVVFHDWKINRLADKKGRIRDYSLEELEKVKLYEGEKVSFIPSFESYLKRAKEIRQPLLIELKLRHFDDKKAFIDDMMDLIDYYDYRDYVIFQSIDFETAKILKEDYPDLKVGYILGLNIGQLAADNFDFYSIEDSFITSNVLDSIFMYEKELFVWTLNDTSRIQRYINTGANGMITDELEQMQEMIENYQAFDLYQKRLFILAPELSDIISF